MATLAVGDKGYSPARELGSERALSLGMEAPPPNMEHVPVPANNQFPPAIVSRTLPEDLVSSLVKDDGKLLDHTSVMESSDGWLSAEHRYIAQDGTTWPRPTSPTIERPQRHLEAEGTRSSILKVASGSEHCVPQEISDSESTQPLGALCELSQPLKFSTPTAKKECKRYLLLKFYGLPTTRFAQQVATRNLQMSSGIF